MLEHTVTGILALLVVGYWVHVIAHTVSRNGIVSTWQRHQGAAASRRQGGALLRIYDDVA
jgi:hypothetical protein